MLQMFYVQKKVSQQDRKKITCCHLEDQVIYVIYKQDNEENYLFDFIWLKVNMKHTTAKEHVCIL